MAVLNLDNLTFPQNQMLNGIAADVRSIYPGIIENLAKGKEHELHWIVSSLASRNKYISPLFLRCCQLSLVKKNIENCGVNEIHLSDSVLAKLLKKHYADSGIKIICSVKISQKIKKILRPVVSFSQLFMRYTFRILNRSRRNQIRGNGNPLTLLDTFVIHSTNGEQGSITNGEYLDRYYPGLLDAFSQEEHQHIYYIPTPIGFKSISEAYKLIRSSKTNFILRDDYLKISDFLYALSHPFVIRNYRYAIIFHDHFNILSLINDEKYFNSYIVNSCEGILFNRFAYRLSKSNIRVKLFVNWYENQPLDKGAIIGFHKYLPETKVKGYQGFIISKLLHHYVYPTRLELQVKAVPDQIAVIGSGLMDDVKEFCPKASVTEAPAFRNNNVWAKKKQTLESNRFTVLVSLPMDMKAAKSLAHIVYDLPKIISGKEVDLLFKPHPSYGAEAIGLLFPHTNQNVKIVTGNFNDQIEVSNILIGNASITSVEALAKGIPVILVGESNGIIQNPIPEGIPAEIWKICFSTAEINQAIEYFINTQKVHSGLYSKIGHEIRKNYFCPVTRENSRNFLLG